MIRTANLTDSISRKAGGLHESVRRLVQSVAETGVEVRVLSVEDEFTEQDRAVWQAVPITIFPRTWPYSFGYSPGFLKELNGYRPDLIHTHGIWLYPSIATTVYCTRRNVPYMISPHGMVDPWAVRHHRMKKMLAYAIFESNHIRGARCIRALCESEARSLRAMGVKNPVAVIPNGIDIPKADSLKAETLNGATGESDIDGAPRGSGERAGGERIKLDQSVDRGQRSEVRSQKSESGRKTLLYLGRLHPKKNLAALLRAFSAVQRSDVRGQMSEWRLAIAGWDQAGYEAELKSLASDLGILTSVSFVGPKFGEEKAAAYRNADAFILPSLSEGLPMVVLEAWAHGKPVLMTAECNLPEGFSANAAIRIGTAVEEIEQGLRTLCTASEEDLRTIGRRGRALVEERFTWSRIAEQVKTAYEWMLGAGQMPECMFTEN